MLCDGISHYVYTAGDYVNTGERMTNSVIRLVYTVAIGYGLGQYQHYVFQRLLCSDDNFSFRPGTYDTAHVRHGGV